MKSTSITSSRVESSTPLILSGITLTTHNTPSPTDNGSTGQFAIDVSGSTIYLYICAGINDGNTANWVRTELSTYTV